jgi:hypothetical protein
LLAGILSARVGIILRIAAAIKTRFAQAVLSVLSRDVIGLHHNGILGYFPQKKPPFTTTSTRGTFVCNSMARMPMWATGGCDMWLEPQPTEMISVVVGMFERFGASPQTLFDLEETIQIEKGRHIARIYRVEGLMAMWLIGIGIVQFYDAEGNMLATMNVLKEAVPQQMVA